MALTKQQRLKFGTLGYQLARHARTSGLRSIAPGREQELIFRDPNEIDEHESPGETPDSYLEAQLRELLDEEALTARDFKRAVACAARGWEAESNNEGLDGGEEQVALSLQIGALVDENLSDPEAGGAEDESLVEDF